MIVESCRLDRQYGRTLVTLVPGNNYFNRMAIIKLSDFDQQNLFTSPQLPGDFYNITVDIFAQDLLLERQTVNLSRIRGFELSRNNFII